MGGGSFDSDAEFESHTIEGADPGPLGETQGWTLRLADGMCIWCTGEHCSVAPQKGETARLYGRGFGYRVRGIIINGRVYRYQTAAEDAAEFKAQCEKWSAEREKAAEKHRAEIATGKHAPVPFRVKESARADYEKGLANNTDPYGRCCYLFAAEWAALMEAEIASGKTVAAVAEETSKVADRNHGVTGFIYGCAVSILAHCWEHGEDLRRWHNLDTQVGKEGERANESCAVLNPVVLSIG